MCGISGIIYPNVNRYSKQLSIMTECLKHRGPDGRSVHLFENAGLGHARLSIIDLSTGDQPMLSADNKIGLIFNGEIYGYKAIRDNLKGGYRFKTKSDTEVIIALYKKYGSDLVNHLPGMFVYALWDDLKQELHVARDRFGEKPFYYAFGKNGEFIFGSEIKSIIASGLITPKLNKNALAHYLKHLYVHPSQTIYENIFTLAPGHKLIFKKGKVVISRYYRLPKINKGITFEDAVEEFKQLLDVAVKNQLVADVPVGAFLSGGLDSSTIVALASKYKDNIKTFSFNFPGDRSEIKYAREIAKKYHTDHRELSDDVDIAKLLLKMATVFDEPFADSSNIPTYLISKLTKKYVTVVLTGDGGDELLGGYSWYKPYLLWPENPSFRNLKKIFFKQLMIMSNLRSNRRVLFKRDMILAQYYSSFNLPIYDLHKLQNIYFTDSDIQGLLGRFIMDFDNKYDLPKSHPAEEAMYADVLDYMPGDILVKTDRASMANGLELRSPFLDKDVANFLLSLPQQFKISGDEDKMILRETFSELWTESIRHRSKQGFGAPVEKWLQKKNVQMLKKEYLEKKGNKMFKVMDYERVQFLGRKDNYLTWILLVLSIWFEHHTFEL